MFSPVLLTREAFLGMERSMSAEAYGGERVSPDNWEVGHLWIACVCTSPYMFRHHVHWGEDKSLSHLLTKSPLWESWNLALFLTLESFPEWCSLDHAACKILTVQEPDGCFLTDEHRGKVVPRMFCHRILAASCVPGLFPDTCLLDPTS